MIMRAPAEEHPDEYWDKVLTVNLDAQFILAREIGKQMIKRGSGKIIFICSLLTFQGGISVPGYAASKGALGSLVKALANEWASKGVNVNGIAPGYINTDNTLALRNDLTEVRPSWIEYLRGDGATLKIFMGRWYFFPPLHQIMYTALS